MLLNTSVKAWLLGTFLCIQSIFTFAQRQNFYVNKTEPAWIVKISPKAYKVKAKDVSDGYYLGLLDKQNHAERKEEYRHYIREIISQTGVQNGSEISVTYDPSFQKLTFHKIVVWRNNQPIDKLQATKFKILQNEKELSKFIYSGTYDAYLILDDIRKGDRIEFAYTISGNNPIFGDKYSNTFYFEGSSSYGREYMNLIVSKNRKLQFKAFNFSGKPSHREANGMLIYEWEHTNTNSYRQVDFEPSWYVPHQYTQVSEYQTWNDVVNWGLAVNRYLDLKTPKLDLKVAELQRASGHSADKYIELATRFVQDDIRYMGVEMGEYSQRPNSPEQVLIQRYGDCKDKSLLLIYLLERASIPAYMAYVDTYAGKRTSEFLPSPFLFDHAVVVVEYNQVKTWIDPTISNQRGTFKTIYFPNYGQALVLKPGVDKPEDVISIPTGKLVSNLNFVVPDTAAGKIATLIINSTYSDNYADNMRSTIADEGLEGLENSFLEYISKYYPEAKIMGNLVIKDDEAENTITITEQYNLGNIWLRSEKSANRPYMYYYGDLIDSELRIVKDKSRKEPLALKYPVNIEQNISVQLPAAWKYDSESTKVESDNYYFEFNSFTKGNILKLNYSYRNFKDHIEPGDIVRYIKDVNKINNNMSIYFYYGGGGTAADNNPYLLLIGILTFVISGIYFLRVYQKPAPYNMEQIIAAPALGGWLLFLAIVQVFDPFSILFAAAKYNIFNIDTPGSADRTTHALMLVTQTLKVISYAIEFAWSMLIIKLIFSRRENLPQQYIRYMYLQAAIVLITVPLDCLIAFQTKQTRIITTQHLVSSLIGVIICFVLIAYFKRSTRVKRTFVFPYPELEWKTDMIKYTNALITANFAKQKAEAEVLNKD
jgi:hypothetical protein